MAGRDAVRMTEEETWAFLAEQRKLQVATLGRDGAPHLTTLFHVVLDGTVVFWTYGRSQKVRNLERDARLSCLVEAGEAYAELRGVSISGTGELVRDPAEVLAVGRAVGARMAGVPDLADLGEHAAQVEGMVAAQAAKRVAVRVRPDSVATWDHRKTGGLA